MSEPTFSGGQIIAAILVGAAGTLLAKLVASLFVKSRLERKVGWCEERIYFRHANVSVRLNLVKIYNFGSGPIQNVEMNMDCEPLGLTMKRKIFSIGNVWRTIVQEDQPNSIVKIESGYRVLIEQLGPKEVVELTFGNESFGSVTAIKSNVGVVRNDLETLYFLRKIDAFKYLANAWGPAITFLAPLVGVIAYILYSFLRQRS